MWPSGTPDKLFNVRFFGKHARGSRIWGIRRGAPVNASRFFVMPDWVPYATATCKCLRAWQAALAASLRGIKKSRTVGCREYTLIFVSSETAPCSRASARVLVRGAGRMRHFHAKERAGKAGSRRASDRIFLTKKRRRQLRGRRPSTLRTWRVQWWDAYCCHYA